MERINEITITVTIETNKGTYTGTFTNMEAAAAWYEATLKEL